jgi:hypothetical protein
MGPPPGQGLYDGGPEGGPEVGCQEHPAALCPVDPLQQHSRAHVRGQHSVCGVLWPYDDRGGRLLCKCESCAAIVRLGLG